MPLTVSGEPSSVWLSSVVQPRPALRAARPVQLVLAVLPRDDRQRHQPPAGVAGRPVDRHAVAVQVGQVVQQRGLLGAVAAQRVRDHRVVDALRREHLVDRVRHHRVRGDLQERPVAVGERRADGAREPHRVAQVARPVGAVPRGVATAGPPGTSSRSAASGGLGGRSAAAAARSSTSWSMWWLWKATSESTRGRSGSSALHCRATASTAVDVAGDHRRAGGGGDGRAPRRRARPAGALRLVEGQVDHRHARRAGDLAQQRGPAADQPGAVDARSSTPATTAAAISPTECPITAAGRRPPLVPDLGERHLHRVDHHLDAVGRRAGRLRAAPCAARSPSPRGRPVRARRAPGRTRARWRAARGPCRSTARRGRRTPRPRPSAAPWSARPDVSPSPGSASRLTQPGDQLRLARGDDAGAVAEVANAAGSACARRRRAPRRRTAARRPSATRRATPRRSAPPPAMAPDRG